MQRTKLSCTITEITPEYFTKECIESDSLRKQEAPPQVVCLIQITHLQEKGLL